MTILTKRLDIGQITVAPFTRLLQREMIAISSAGVTWPSYQKIYV